MKSFTVPFLAAMIAMFSVVGTSHAATIDDLFDTVLETEVMIVITDNELARIESRCEVVFAHVDELYIEYKTGADPKLIRSELDNVSMRVAEMKACFHRLRGDLRHCEDALNAAQAEAEQWAAKGHYKAPKLLRLIKYCRDDLATAQSRTGECAAGLTALRKHIEGLYALLPLA